MCKIQEMSLWDQDKPDINKNQDWEISNLKLQLSHLQGRDEAHQEELQRVKQETEDRVTADFSQQLNETKEQLEKFKEKDTKFREQLKKAMKPEVKDDCDGEMVKKKRGRPATDKMTWYLRIPASMYNNIELLKNTKFITQEQITKEIEMHLEPILAQKIAVLNDYLEELKKE